MTYTRRWEGGHWEYEYSGEAKNTAEAPMERCKVCHKILLKCTCDTDLDK